MISILRQRGVTRLLEDSSGNGGAAIAAYAAAGAIKAKMTSLKVAIDHQATHILSSASARMPGLRECL